MAADGVTVKAVVPALIRDIDMLPGDPEELAARGPGRAGGAAVGLRHHQVVAVGGGIHPG